MSARNSNVFLVGPMGSGKTAVGKHLARLMRAPFRDSDAEIEARTGVDISYIFSREGEEGFRMREREIIEEVTRESPIVLATGGGAILLEANRKVLRERGFVVYLRTSLEQQVERVRQGRNRPLLHDVDPMAKLTELMTERAPLYESISDFTVATDGRKVHMVADSIYAAFKAAQNTP
jgi:shikimate kinase